MLSNSKGRENITHKEFFYIFFQQIKTDLKAASKPLCTHNFIAYLDEVSDSKSILHFENWDAFLKIV